MGRTSDTLISRLGEARTRTDELFRLLAPSVLYDRPIPERNRNIFYLGHLEAFDWNLLSGRALDLEPFDPAFDKLFSFGIDPIDGGLPKDQPADWPRVDQVRDYNNRVRGALDGGIGKAFASGHDLEFPLHLLLNTAIEHRLMHAETLAYMFNQLPIKCLAGSSEPAPAAACPVEHRMLDIPSGEATLGLADNGNFGWDNEFKLHRVSVPAFSIGTYSVTNGDYLKFIEAGGYQNRDHWTEEGWQWLRESKTEHPAFWRKNDGRWFLRTMFSETLLPSDWPVYVSHAEASAYCRWSGKSLPSEAEWHRAAYGARDERGGEERLFPWGNEAPTTARGNFDFARWNPAPVNAHPLGASAYGVMDMLGNGYEWTSTVFFPFPGFEAFPFYPGYSANFFDGRHYVIKGGSARTARCMLRRSFRNWFQPNYPYAYAKFRMVAR